MKEKPGIVPGQRSNNYYIIMRYNTKSFDGIEEAIEDYLIDNKSKRK